MDFEIRNASPNTEEEKRYSQNTRLYKVNRFVAM